MQSYQIGTNEAGQRFDKFLHKYMPEATSSFLYKMLRKKNITLNSKKAEGKEILKEGDNISFFFAEETFEKFRGKNTVAAPESLIGEYLKAYKTISKINILYEDNHVLIADKPAGILSQKAKDTDLSLNEWLIGYMLEQKQISTEQLETFKPAVCNRLDRNTSGIVLCGKSLPGSQELSKLIKERLVGKYYRTFVKGVMEESNRISGSLIKDGTNNKVSVSSDKDKGQAIETAYKPIGIKDNMTYLEVELITGKTHQIRAHLASVGHPVAGDGKYGNSLLNEKLKKDYGVKWQLLHAYRMEFPPLTGTLEGLNNRVIIAPLPKIFEKILAGK